MLGIWQNGILIQWLASHGYYIIVTGPTVLVEERGSSRGRDHAAIYCGVPFSALAFVGLLPITDSPTATH